MFLRKIIKYIIERQIKRNRGCWIIKVKVNLQGIRMYKNHKLKLELKMMTYIVYLNKIIKKIVELINGEVDQEKITFFLTDKQSILKHNLF